MTSNVTIVSRPRKYGTARRGSTAARLVLALTLTFAFHSMDVTNAEAIRFKREEEKPSGYYLSEALEKAAIQGIVTTTTAESPSSLSYNEYPAKVRPLTDPRFFYRPEPSPPLADDGSREISPTLQSNDDDSESGVHERRERHYDTDTETLGRNSFDFDGKQKRGKDEKGELKQEENYEVDERVNVETNGRDFGVRTKASEEGEKNQKKTGYVVEGRNFKRYRVEERTSDGFIVGEFGVLSRMDGSLRGVRYTAQGNINPKVISQALLKFLNL